MNNIMAIAEMLSDQIQQELKVGHTLSDVEKTARTLLGEIGRQTIALVVKAEEAAQLAPEAPCAATAGPVKDNVWPNRSQACLLSLY
jgi:hypothetical protein